MTTQPLQLPALKIHKTAFTPALLFNRFINSCASQQKYRLAWLGGSLTFHGCVLTPVTLFTVITSGVNPLLLSITATAIMLNMVVNLAALPTKITIPVFVLTFLADILVICAALTIGLDLTKVF